MTKGERTAHLLKHIDLKLDVLEAFATRFPTLLGERYKKEIIDPRIEKLDKQIERLSAFKKQLLCRREPWD